MAVLSTLALSGSAGTVGVIVAVVSGQDNTVTVAIIAGAAIVLAPVVPAVLALLAKDRKPVDPARHIPETAEALSQEMTQVDELRAENRELRDELRHERANVDLWQQRAYEAGYLP